MTAATKRGRASWGRGREGCEWCGGGGTVSSSIDIHQPECPCVMELDREEDPELAALDAALDAERERRRDPATALLRITTHLSRYSCAGPIPLRFAASLGDADITIEAIVTSPDACAARDGSGPPSTTRTRGGVAYDADERTIGDQVAMLARVAVLHELGEFLCFDGAPLRDPHRGPGGRS